jgi:hypothetical protein
MKLSQQNEQLMRLAREIPMGRTQGKMVQFTTGTGGGDLASEGVDAVSVKKSSVVSGAGSSGFPSTTQREAFNEK